MFTRMLFLCQHTSLLEESKLQVRLKEWNLPANTISLVDAQTDIFIFTVYNIVGKRQIFSSFIFFSRYPGGKEKAFQE